MLDKKQCKATVLRSEACTPAFAADSVREFMRQASKHLHAALQAWKSTADIFSMQEVELPADVQRNLNAAVAALEELEQHRNPTLGLKQGM